MKFSVLMLVVAFLIKLNLKRRKYLRDMISVKKLKVVWMTKDGRHGIRFIICNGTFSTDRILHDYDLAYVWKDGDTAFKVLTSSDPTALHKAIANWDLELKGEESLNIPFSLFLGYATGKLKKN